jgi:hypothetical protein
VISVPDHVWRKLAAWIVGASIVASLAIFTIRGVSTWHAAALTPGMAISSGGEEESIFALWKVVHGHALYADTSRLPYASAYFNWLFYASYGASLGVAVKISGDPYIPAVGRLITAMGALAGAGTLWWFLRKIVPGQSLLAGGLATFVYLGPLAGWWVHTVRPDIWALALETAALVVLLTTCRARPLAAAGVSCLLFYGAWSFKQTFVIGLATALLFLVVRRQWRPAAVLGLGSAALWFATFAAMGPGYFAAIRAAGRNSVFYPDIGLTNLRDMLQKCAPLWLLAAAYLAKTRVRPAKTPAALAADARLLGLVGLLLSLPLTFVASCKLGATTNYYFTPLLLLAIFSAGLGAAVESPKCIILGFSAALALQLAVALGLVGQLSLLPQARDLAATWAVWQREPEPRFSAACNLNQPWLNPGSPPLVLAFNYSLDRQAGRRFEGGGVGGLIVDGFFRSLLLPAETRGEYDGGSLSRYTRGETVNHLTVFRRGQNPEK